MTQQQIDYDICDANHGGNANSVAAHESIKNRKKATWQAILAELRLRPDGATCHQIEETLNLSHQSTSARFSELKRAGMVVINGKRPTSSGRLAAVYFARKAS